METIHSVQDTIIGLYNAFNILDIEALHSIYHPEAVFTDPVFGTVVGGDILLMWQMLLKRQTIPPFKVHYTIDRFHKSEVDVSAVFEYVYTPKNRMVVNHIHSIFELDQDLKIIKQTDAFGVSAWTRQVFGISHNLISWTPMYRNNLRQKVRSTFNQYKSQRQNRYG